MTTNNNNNFICCKRCTKPLFPFSSILAQKIDVWSDTVYTYQLEDVLPDHGIEGGCHLYSATNPGQRRFDVFRVKVLEDSQQQSKWSKGITVNIDTRSKSYSSEHSWFPNFDWTFCECSNCGNHVGWGFAPKIIAKNDDADNDDDDDDSTAKTAKALRIPEFMGCIFANIIAKEITDDQWIEHLRLRSSVTHQIRLNLLRAAWPALKDDLRLQIMTFMSSLLLRYDAETKNVTSEEKNENDNGIDHGKKNSSNSAKLHLRHYLGLMNRLENVLGAAESFILRLRERRRENETNQDNSDSNNSTLEPNTIPFFRDQIDLQEYKLDENELETEEQHEVDDNDELEEEEEEEEEKRARAGLELIRGFHFRWKGEVAAAEEKRRQREREQQEDEHGRGGIMALFRTLLGLGNDNRNAVNADEAAGDVDEYVDAELTDDDDDQDDEEYFDEAEEEHEENDENDSTH